MLTNVCLSFPTSPRQKFWLNTQNCGRSHTSSTLVLDFFRKNWQPPFQQQKIMPMAFLILFLVWGTEQHNTEGKDWRKCNSGLRCVSTPRYHGEKKCFFFIAKHSWMRAYDGTALWQCTSDTCMTRWRWYIVICNLRIQVSWLRLPRPSAPPSSLPELLTVHHQSV